MQPTHDWGYLVISSVVPEFSQELITVLGIAAIALLILLSAFFASSEIAIFSLSDHRISTLVDEDVSGASTLAELKSNPRRLLVTILVGNNIANIGMSSVATGLLGLYFAPGQAVLIATFGITSLVLLFGESAPKTYAVENSESWGLRVSRPLKLAEYVMYPLVVVFDFLTRGVNKLLGSEGDFESAYVTRSEIQEMIEVGQREGVFTDEEHLMLQRLLRFRNRIVKETMVPRLDVVGLEADTDVTTALESCLDHGYNQFPVYEETLDTVVGVVHIRDLARATDGRGEQSVREIAEDPYIVPETKDVDELLTELRTERRRMAVVADEFGTTAGIVTIEDIVEEIIGEILSERESVPIRWLDDRVALVRGELNVHEMNDGLGTSFPETGEFESVAGLLLSEAGEFIGEGETIVEEGIRLTAETVENNRILEVRVELPERMAS